MEIDRRQNPRFYVRDNAFAVFQPEPVKLVPIIDISLGGLGIGVNGIRISDDWLDRASSLEILIDDCSFYMDNLPYELLPKLRDLPRDTVHSFQNIFRKDPPGTINAASFYSLSF